MFKRIAFLTAIVLMAIPAWALTFNVGNYKYYTTGSGNVTVDGFSPSATNSAMSTVNFPGRVYYNGEHYNVTSVGSYSFCNNLNIEEVVIPYGVTEIEESAFEGCTNLDVVRISSSVQRMQADCFGGCTGSLYVYIAASTPPTCIDGPFDGAVLTRLNVRRDDPAIMTKYKNATGWKNFSQFYSTANVYDARTGTGTSVGYFVFEKENNQLHLMLVGGGTTCNVPSDITINGTTYPVTEIGAYSFSSSGSVNGAITKITGAYNVETIGKAAFKGSSISTATFPNVMGIGDEAFMNCTSLSSISFGENIDRPMFFGSKSFYKCTSLTSLNLPYNYDADLGDSSLKFGTYAFAYSGLTKLILPRTTRNIEEYAFAYCPSLKYVYIHRNINRTGNIMFYYFENNAFKNINNGGVTYIHVPFASLKYYRDLWDTHFTSMLGDLDKITIDGVDMDSVGRSDVRGLEVEFNGPSITLNNVNYSDQNETFIKTSCQHLKVYCKGANSVNSKCVIEARHAYTDAAADVSIVGLSNGTLYSYGKDTYTFDFDDAGNLTIKDIPNFTSVNKNCAVFYGDPSLSLLTINNSSGSFTRQNKQGNVISGFKTLTLIDTELTNCTYSPTATSYGSGTGLVTFGSTIAQMVGDLDGNGKLEVNDVVMLADIAMGGAMNGVSLTVADLDGNGKVEVNDVVMLAGMVMGS